jgi:3-dehydroquinate synthase
MRIQFPSTAGKRILELIDHNDCCFVVDKGIAKLYKLPFSTNPVLKLQSGEACKSIKTLKRLLDFFLAHTVTASSRVVVVGGGAVCDVAGFAASIFKRGIPAVYVPTTLLAQVDAAYGGKTAINYRGVKNAVGSFAQPDEVIADSNFLLTLPHREYLSGLGEILKYGTGFDSELFAILENNSEIIARRDTALLATIISRCMAIKNKIVEQDPKEQNERRLLNLGHTFGHAFESVLRVSHGYAVALGILAAAKVSVKLDILQEDSYLRVLRLAENLGFKATLPRYSKRYDFYIRQDKKSIGSVIKFIIPNAIGSAKIAELDPRSLIAMVYET